MTAYIRHLSPGGQSITTNQSDDRLFLQDGTVLGAFSAHTQHTYTCAHCGHCIPLQTLHSEVGNCAHCRNKICDSCVLKLWNGEDTCRPFKEPGGDLDLYERGKLKVLR